MPNQPHSELDDERIRRMLPSFVIGLREGLEAALIVGIIAAFLRKQGRRDLLRWVLIGVAIAIAICLGAGIALRAYSQELPQRQQEGLETVIAIVAVGMVTYMVVWMRRNSRNLKGQLEDLAADALAGSSNAGRAMVLMAFLAVIREGLETVVFLLAAFNETANGATAGAGATIGILIAVVLGYGIYRGGVRLNLSKFFRITGFVLVLVAAGLVVNALHTAHEAGWVNAGQGRTVDLTWLVEPGTVQASLLTGMLGLQPRPVVIEVIGWLIYLIPVGLYITWKPGRPAPTRLAVRGGAVVAVLAAVGALLLTALAPSAPATHPRTTGANLTARVVSRDAQTAIVSTRVQQPTVGTTGASADVRLRFDSDQRRAGVSAQRFTATMRGTTGAAGRPASLSIERVAELNGSRPPIGISSSGGQIPVTYADTVTLVVWLDGRTDRVLDTAWTERVTVVAGTPSNNAPLAQPVDVSTLALPASARTDAAAAARSDHDRLDRRSVMHTLGAWCWALAIVAVLVAAGFWLASRRRTSDAPIVTQPAGTLVKS